MKFGKLCFFADLYNRIYFFYGRVLIMASTSELVVDEVKIKKAIQLGMK